MAIKIKQHDIKDCGAACLASIGKTVIIIAHRLSTISSADTIIVMENGTIVEQVNHKDLLTLDQKYAGLWKKQSLV